MDEVIWFVLAVAVVLGLPLGAVLGWVAFARTRALGREIAGLKLRLAVLEAGPAAAAAEPLEASPALETPLPEAEPPPAEAEPPPAAEPVVAATPATPGRRRRDLEEAIGTRWAVWVGGVALALGGVFLVRFSIEAGLIGPGLRVTAGLLFAALLLALGEWLRRTGAGETPSAARGAYVPGVLTAAGTVAAFATTYAAYVLYGFLGDGAAFLALAAVSFVTLALALVHGWGLAGLGLAASYATPLLVSSDRPWLLALAAYLLAVTAATLMVARLRRWRWLGAAGVAGAVAWALVMEVVSGFPGFDGPVIAAYGALAFAMTYAAFTGTIHPSDPGRVVRGHDLVAAGLLALFGLPAVGHVATFGVTAPGLLAVVGFGAATLVIAYMHAALRLLVLAGAAVVLAGFTAFDPALLSPFDPTTGTLMSAGAAGALDAAATDRMIGAGVLIGLLFAALGLFGVAGSASRALQAVAGAGIPLGLLVITYIVLGPFEPFLPFGFSALALAGFFAVSTEALARRLTAGKHGVDASVAVYAVATVAAVAAGLAMLFERGVLTIALSAMVPAIAAVEAARPVRGLRPVAVAIAAVVAVRFALDPAVVGADLGTTPVFNWLLWGYGVPAAAFAFAAWRFGRTRADRFVPVFEGLAVTFATLTVVMLVHHAMAGGNLYAPVSGLAEQSLLSMSLMAVSLGLQWLALRRASPVLSGGMLVLGALGLLGAGLGLLVAENPLLTGEPITGGTFDGTLVLGYVAPALLALAVAVVARKRPDRPDWFVLAAGALAGLLVFAWATLAVRAAWHPGDLGAGSMAEGELYAYSAVWLACGLVMLAAGAATGVRALRLVSGALIAVVVAKVFLVDTAGLTGALRAASFIGLGAVLVAVGLAYQRLMRRPAALTAP